MAEVFTTNLNTITLSELTDAVERYYVTVNDMVKPVARQLYQIDNIGFNKGDTKVYNEYDISTFAHRKPEGVSVSKAKAGLGYQKTGTALRFGEEVEVTEEMRMLGKDMEVKKAFVSLVSFIPQREELDLTHRLTFGTSTSYTDLDGQTVDVSMGDGYALFYSAHTLAGDSATYRNRVLGDPLVSQGALEMALSLTVTDIKSNLGEKRTMNFNTIWSGNDPSTVHEIKRLMKSTSDSTQDNSGVINPLANLFSNHVIFPYLATTATGANDSTKAKWWGICAAGEWAAYLGIIEPQNLRTPSKDNNLVDAHTDIWSYGVRQMRMITIPSGRGIIASCPVS